MLNTVWKMYLNTNTVFSILNIHKIHLKLAIQEVTLLRSVYTQERYYKDHYISVF